MVPFKKVEFAITELVNRLGINETARRIPLGHSSLWKYRNKKPTHIHRATAERILTALHTTRINGDARHKDSIQHGAIVRGHKEKIPKHRRDFYSKQGDIENEKRRNFRRTHGV